jgi:hypothetical protein
LVHSDWFLHPVKKKNKTIRKRIEDFIYNFFGFAGLNNTE